MAPTQRGQRQRKPVRAKWKEGTLFRGRASFHVQTHSAGVFSGAKRTVMEWFPRGGAGDGGRAEEVAEAWVPAGRSRSW